MSGESPNAVLYDVNGNALAIQNATAIPASTPALMIAGSDGTNSRYITTDSSGRIIHVGAAAAGSATSGNPVLTAGSDGTSVRTLLLMNTPPVGTEFGLVVRTLPGWGNQTSFMASTNGMVTFGTAANTVTSVAYLFHPSSNTKRISISRIEVCITNITAPAVAPNGVVSIRGAFITAENGTPGGTSQTINPTDRADSVSTGMVFRTGATGAPTRVAGDLINWLSSVNQGPYFVWDSGDNGAKPIVLRASTAEGFEIRTNIEVASGNAPQVSVFYYWTEQ